MIRHIKTIILVLVVGFALYYLVTNPEGAADYVRILGGWLQSVLQFFASLAK